MLVEVLAEFYSNRILCFWADLRDCSALENLCHGIESKHIWILNFIQNIIFIQDTILIRDEIFIVCEVIPSPKTVAQAIRAYHHGLFAKPIQEEINNSFLLLCLPVEDELICADLEDCW